MSDTTINNDLTTIAPALPSNPPESPNSKRLKPKPYQIAAMILGGSAGGLVALSVFKPDLFKLSDKKIDQKTNEIKSPSQSESNSLLLPCLLGVAVMVTIGILWMRCRSAKTDNTSHEKKATKTKTAPESTFQLKISTKANKSYTGTVSPTTTIKEIIITSMKQLWTPEEITKAAGDNKYVQLELVETRRLNRVLTPDSRVGDHPISAASSFAYTFTQDAARGVLLSELGN